MENSSKVVAGTVGDLLVLRRVPIVVSKNFLPSSETLKQICLQLLRRSKMNNAFPKVPKPPLDMLLMHPNFQPNLLNSDSY